MTSLEMSVIVMHQLPMLPFPHHQVIPRHAFLHFGSNLSRYLEDHRKPPDPWWPVLRLNHSLPHATSHILRLCLHFRKHLEG